MARELLTFAAMALLTVLIHLGGLMGLMHLTRFHIEHLRSPWLTLDRLLVPLGMALGLFVLHGVEVSAYAVLFQFVHATHGWEAAIYLSAGAYSTAGWSGLTVPDGWRVVAALESLNGMLLIGWSTAFLFQTLHRILQTEENHPLPEGAIAPDADDDPEEAAAEQAER